MNSDNDKVTFTLNVEEVPLLLDCLHIGSATALAYGARGKGARGRLKELIEQVEVANPFPSCGGTDGHYTWLDSVTAVRECSGWRVFAVKAGGYWNPRWDVVLVVDDGSKMRSYVVGSTKDEGEAQTARDSASEIFAGVGALDASYLDCETVSFRADGLRWDAGTHYSYRSDHRSDEILEAVSSCLQEEYGEVAKRAEVISASVLSDGTCEAVLVGCQPELDLVVERVRSDRVSRVEETAVAKP